MEHQRTKQPKDLDTTDLPYNMYFSVYPSVVAALSSLFNFPSYGRLCFAQPFKS